MGLMDIIRKMRENKNESKEKFKQMQEDDRLHNMLQERKKSANQRELEKIIKNREEQQIKKTLETIRKKENTVNWKGESILKGGTSILKNDMPILKDGKSILHQKNIFLDNKTKVPMTEEKLFFKW